MMYLPSLNVAYQLRKLSVSFKERVLIVASLSDVPSLETEDHLASSPGPEQTCVARRHYIPLLKFKVELKGSEIMKQADMTDFMYHTSENFINIWKIRDYEVYKEYVC